MANNDYEKMKVAEWRGAVGAKLDNIEDTLAEVCTAVRKHETAIAVLQNQRENTALSRRARAAIISATILAVASITVAIIGTLT